MCVPIGPFPHAFDFLFSAGIRKKIFIKFLPFFCAVTIGSENAQFMLANGSGWGSAVMLAGVWVHLPQPK